MNKIINQGAIVSGFLVGPGQYRNDAEAASASASLPHDVQSAGPGIERGLFRFSSALSAAARTGFRALAGRALRLSFSAVGSWALLGAIVGAIVLVPLLTASAQAQDITPPTLSSFTRQTPATSPTNADTLIFRAVFDEDVQNVDAADFVPTGTSATISGVSTVTAATYDITVTGGDLAGLNGIVGLDLAVTQDITDLASNALPAGEPTTDETYALDNTPPTVTLTTPATPVAGPFVVTFTFSEAVTGFDAIADITVVNGTTDAPVDSGGGMTYTATITPTATGNVEVSVGAGIAADAATNGNAASGTLITAFDDIDPTVAIIAPATLSDLTPFLVTYTFSEVVTGFDAIADITVVNGTTDAPVDSGDGMTYTATITPTGAGDVTIDVAAGIAQDAAGNPNTAAVQAVVGSTIAEDTRLMIGAFIEDRARLIMQNGPDRNRRLERLKGTYTNNGGVFGFGFAYTNGNLPMTVALSKEKASFSYSFRKSQTEGAVQSLSMQTAFAPSYAMSDDGGTFRESLLAFDDEKGGRRDADPMQYRTDIWVEGTLAHIDATGGEGTFGILHGGFDYLLTRNLLIGLGIQGDWMEQGTVSGSGYLVGPYATARLTNQLYFDARGAWGQSFNDVSPLGTYTDEFDAERWLASAALIGDFEVGAWNIRPEARVDYFEEKTEAYIDGLGGSIASVRASVGELTFGPTFTYTMRPAGGVAAATFIGVDGIWTFASENTATIASPGTIGLADTGLRARAEAGLSVNHDDGFSFSASAFYDGIGNDDFEAWGGKARISKQF